MNIDDCNGCRSEDCDACCERRKHAKHRHCTGCQGCLEACYELDECEKCRLESGEIMWCTRCEDVTTDDESGMCQPCWNANEQAGIDHEMDKFFGGGCR